MNCFLGTNPNPDGEIGKIGRVRLEKGKDSKCSEVDEISYKVEDEKGRVTLEKFNRRTMQMIKAIELNDNQET